MFFSVLIDKLTCVAKDMLGTGSETVATVLQWILAELARNPRRMQKVQDEVRRVLAGRRRVTEDNLTIPVVRVHLPIIED